MLERLPDKNSPDYAQGFKVGANWKLTRLPANPFSLVTKGYRSWLKGFSAGVKEGEPIKLLRRTLDLNNKSPMVKS